MSAPIELDLDALVAAAEAAKNATDGRPWRFSEHFRVVTTSTPGVLQYSREVASTSMVESMHGVELGKHITAAQPAVVLELVRRLRAAEGAARFFYAKYICEGILGDEQCGELERQELAVPDIAARAVPPEHEFADGDAVLAQAELDEQLMLAAGWVRAEKTIPAPPPIKPEPKCKECGDEMCGGTGIYEFRKCDGIPF